MKDDLTTLRVHINELDRALIEILSKRKSDILKIGEIKKMQGKEALDAKRWQEVLESRKQWARELGVEEQVVENIFEAIHTWSLEMQNNG